MTYKEKLESVAQSIVESYSINKGITLYEAGEILKLKKAGKIL